MTRSPKIPQEQRSFDQDSLHRPDAAMDRRDQATGAQSAEPGDADVNLDTQGRFGNLRQNLTEQVRR